MGCKSSSNHVVIGIAITQKYHPAVRLAAEEINSSGGIHGARLELMGLDWRVENESIFTPSDSLDILKWAERFRDAKDLVAVIGHSDSSSTISAAAYYNQHKVPQLVTIATNPAISGIGAWTYRLCLSDAVQGPALADYAANEWGKKRIAVFYANNDYGRGLAQLFEKRSQDLGGVIVSSITHRNVLEADDENMIRWVLEKMRNTSSPQLIVLFQGTSAALWTIKAIQKVGLQTDILGGDFLGSSEFVNGLLGPTPVVRVSQFFFPQETNTRAATFVGNFRTLTQRKPDYGDAFAYDAVYLIRDAVQKNGFSREGVKSYLDHVISEKIRLDGVGGAFTLSPNHDALRSISIVEIHDGKQQFVKELNVH